MVGTDRQSQLTTKSEKQTGYGEAEDVYPAHITYTNRPPFKPVPPPCPCDSFTNRDAEQPIQLS